MRICHLVLLLCFFIENSVFAAPNVSSEPQILSIKQRLEERVKATPDFKKSSLVFDLPVSYNRRVSYWINHFQTKGSNWFGDWLEMSSRYMPMIQNELRMMDLPQDLAYMVMIESGFNHNAKSSANAVGPWQFIQETGERYGLKVNWWLDERRDLQKSTQAAIKYIRSLYKEFDSWYLVAASYNMGENGLRRQIRKHKTRDFWALSRLGALPVETMDYVPKILAAMLISKSPGLYGFTDYSRAAPLEYEIVVAPGGLQIDKLADHIGLTRKALRDLNAELILGSIPNQVKKHSIRIPKGSLTMVTEFIGSHE
jgi:membrane-bound lytic murein transglycosylase D